MPKALAILSPEGNAAFLAPHTSDLAPAVEVHWNTAGVWLIQTASQICDPHKQYCQMESTKVMVLLISLCSTIVLVICAFTFFREDREEQITPLCPQLVVKDAELTFRLPLNSQDEHMDVIDEKNRDNTVCKISMDWPDPFRGSPHGVAATVRVHSRDMTLATVVARNVAVLGQGLALCRTGCEIFGFVEPDGDRYHVRHRTGVHLLTLIGNFDTWDVDGVNPVGSKVCSLKKVDGECVGKVTQHVDAGLVICALMASHVHRRLTVNVPPPWSAAPPMSMPAKPTENIAPMGTPAQFSTETTRAATPAGGPTPGASRQVPEPSETATTVQLPSEETSVKSGPAMGSNPTPDLLQPPAPSQAEGASSSQPAPQPTSPLPHQPPVAG